MPARVTVRASFDEVVAWASEQRGLCLVTDQGGGWTAADLDGPGVVDVLARFGPPLYEEDLEGEIWLYDGDGEPTPLPLYVDDLDDAEEAAAFEATWAAAPPGLAEPDPRLLPPVANQVVLAPAAEDRDLRSCALGIAADLVLVRGERWLLVRAHAEDVVGQSEGPLPVPSAQPIAAGLTANGGRALVLSAGPELGEVLVVRRGHPRGRAVWNLRQELVGRRVREGDTWRGFDLPDATADEIVSAVGGLGETNTSLVRAVLRRRGEPVRLAAQLAGLVAPGLDAVWLEAVLAGRSRVQDHPDAEIVAAPNSFRELMRASWERGAPLDPDHVPWYALLCTLLLPLGLVLWPLRAWELVSGQIDGWGIAQLVGWTTGLPFAVWQAARVRRWWGSRRHTIRA